AALRIEGLAVKARHGGRTLMVVDRLTIGPGERVALLGANGAGKSTLLLALAEAFAAQGPHYESGAAIRFNPGCRLAYFDQAMIALPLDESPEAYLTGLDGVTREAAAKALVQAGFPYRRIGEPIAVLSHGERSRLLFLHMRLRAPNLYLLDEPTSHLDIEGQEALEAQLIETDAACVLVSHDRYFIRAAATRFLEIVRGRIVEREAPDAFFEAQGSSSPLG
ncbi:MAG: ABC-F family ATP-binding cassette domain-containing protein, partial [Caulobacteraceae bacterium]|nr:ABC-F family ATP-binding cassette domain-containing protein [Caulobacteraceae bacterium]